MYTSIEISSTMGGLHGNVGKQLQRTSWYTTGLCEMHSMEVSEIEREKSTLGNLVLGKNTSKPTILKR